MNRILVLIAYALAWVAWLQWGVGFIEISSALGGSYWVGLPDPAASILAWALWPVLVLLVYVLPVALVALIPVILRLAGRSFSKVKNAED